MINTHVGCACHSQVSPTTRRGQPPANASATWRFTSGEHNTCQQAPTPIRWLFACCHTDGTPKLCGGIGHVRGEHGQKVAEAWQMGCAKKHTKSNRPWHVAGAALLPHPLVHTTPPHWVTDTIMPTYCRVVHSPELGSMAHQLILTALLPTHLGR